MPGRIRGAQLRERRVGQPQLVAGHFYRQAQIVHRVLARGTVLATGGCGQVFRVTTNCRQNTGDAHAVALQAGLPLMDMETVQFHPTGIVGPGILASETLRSVGGILRNKDLEPFMVRYAERIASASGCVGTIGIDFMTGDTVHAIEVNPRFQATLDTIEMATGFNLFGAHVGACHGTLPSRRPACRQVAARKILFAEKDMEISRNLVRFSPLIADIPWPGTSFEEGQAVLSVYGWGPGEEAVEAAEDEAGFWEEEDPAAEAAVDASLLCEVNGRTVLGAWEQAVRALQGELSAGNAQVFLREARPWAWEAGEGRLVVRAATGYARDWMAARLGRRLERMLGGILNRAVRVGFEGEG